MSSRILPEFDLLVPQSLDEAKDMLARCGEQVTVMAGGTDVLVGLKDSLRTEHVLALSEVPGLDYIEYDPEQGLRIGALTNLVSVLGSPVIKGKYPALWESAYVHGTPQTREYATVVGNILRGSPAGDCSCAVLALGGTVVFESVDGRREVDIDDIWVDYGVIDRRPNEIAIEVRLPALEDGTYSTFARLTRTYEDLAKLNAAVRIDLDGEVCRDARLAIGCVGPTLRRLPAAEALLRGSRLSDAVLDEIRAEVRDEVDPIDDVRSTAEYRRDVSGPFICRLLRRIRAEAGLEGELSVV